MRIFRIVASLALIALVNCSSEEPAAVDPVPPQLRQIESIAEDAFEKAMVLDYTAVEQDAAALSGQWSAYRPTALKDGLSATDASAVDTAIAGLVDAAKTRTSPTAVARAANAVSAPMDVLFSIYHPPMPSAVIELDYLGRELLLDGTEADFQRASADAAAVGQVWAGVRKQVVDAGGTTEATRFDTTLSAIQAAITAKQDVTLKTKAQEELDLVDVIEAVFPTTADAPD